MPVLKAYSITRKPLRIVPTILLPILLILAGACRQEQKSDDDEDQLHKGMRLFLEQSFEEAYGSFRVAWLLAVTCDNNPERALEAMKGMANCAFWMGELDSCIYRDSLALVLACEQKKQYDEYEIYSQLKQAYMSKADMEQVMLLTQKIDSLTAVSQDVRIQIGIQQRLAQEAMQQLNPKLAEHYYKSNEVLLDSLPQNLRQSMQFIVYGNLRDFYYNQQEYDKVRKYSHLYIEAARKNMKQRQMGYMAYDGDALICAFQKDRKEAFRALDSMKYGLTLQEDASQTNVMHYHEVKGRVHAILGEWDKANIEFKKGLEAAEGTKIVGRASYYQLGRLWGDALCQLKRYDEARDAYCICWAYCKYQYGAESMECADVLFALASLEAQCGEKEAGMKYYMKAIDNCKKIVNEQLRYVSALERNVFWNMFAPCMFTMSSYALKIGETQSLFTEKCYNALLFSKSLLLESDRSMTEAINTECTPQEQRLYSKMQDAQNQLKMLMSNYDNNKDKIETLHQKISALNRQLVPIISKLGYTSFLNQDYENIKELLEDDEVVIDFTDFMTDEREHVHAAFIIKQNQTHPKLIKTFTEGDINRLLEREPDNLPTYFLYNENLSEEAYNLILKPLANEIKGTKTVYYVPSGMMHKIALEALLLKDRTRLGDHYAFVRLTSAREIAKLKKRSTETTHATAALYGALKYDMDTTTMSKEASRYKVSPLFALNRGESARGKVKYKDLPNAKEEMNRIVNVLTKKGTHVKVRTGMKGTEESFLALSGKSTDILHVATHGFFYTPEQAKDVTYLKGFNDAMQLSGLIMSGGNLAWTGKQVPKGVLDGVMTASSVASMDLRGTDLVVLSACQTGLGIATPEGLYGLQRAFKKAGAQTMVVTLWNIDDEAAKDFMIKFYEELANKKWNKRVAFEKAKEFVRGKTYIRKGKSYKGDPYFWAGFVMLD